MSQVPLVTKATRNSASAFFCLRIFSDSHKTTTTTTTTSVSLNIIKWFMFAMCFLRGGNGLFQYFKIHLICTVVDERTGFGCRLGKWGVEDSTNTLSRLSGTNTDRLSVTGFSVWVKGPGPISGVYFSVWCSLEECQDIHKKPPMTISSVTIN